MSEDFNMVAPKKVLIMTRVPLIIQLPGNQTQNFERVQTQSSERGKFRRRFLGEDLRVAQNQAFFVIRDLFYF